MGLLSRVKKSGSKQQEQQQQQQDVAVPARPQVPWDGTKFKIQLKMAKSRIDIQRSKKYNEVDQSRRKIAQHLIDKKEPLARILGDRVLRERTTLISFDIIETCIEVLISSNNNLSMNRDLDKTPGDLKESICSIVYCTSRVNIPELITVVDILRWHYGPMIIDPIARMEGPYSSSVHEVLAIQLSGNPPDGYLILQELEQIAKEHNIGWTPPPEETDLNNFESYNKKFPPSNHDGGGAHNFGGHPPPGGDYGIPNPTYAPSNIPGGAVAPFTPPAPSAPPATHHFPSSTPHVGSAPPAHHFKPEGYPPAGESGNFNDDALQARFNNILDDN